MTPEQQRAIVAEKLMEYEAFNDSNRRYYAIGDAKAFTMY